MDKNYGNAEMIRVEIPGDVVSSLIVALSDEVEELKMKNEDLRTQLYAARNTTKTATTAWAKGDWKSKGASFGSGRVLSPNGRLGMQFSGFVKNLPKEVQAEARATKATHGVRAAIKYIKQWKAGQTTTTTGHENYGQ